MSETKISSKKTKFNSLTSYIFNVKLIKTIKSKRGCFMEVNKNNDVENEICEICNSNIKDCSCDAESLDDFKNSDVSDEEIEILTEDFSSDDISDVIEKYLHNESVSDDENGESSDRVPQKDEVKITGIEKFPSVLHKAVKTPKRSGNVIPHIASVVVCVAIFCVTVLAVGWLALRYSLDNAVLQTAVMNVDVAEIELNDGEKINLTNVIYNGIVENLPEGMEVDKNDVSDFLNEKKVKTFIAEKLADYTGYLKGESQNASVKSREITNFIKKNESLLKEKIGYTPSASDYEKIELGLSEIGFEQKSNINAVEESLNVNLEAVRGFLSKYIFVVISAILVSLIIVLAIINKKKFATFLAYLGTVFAINGLGLVIAVSAVIIALSYAISELKWAKALISVPERAVQNMGVLLLAVGVLLIFTSVIIRKLQSKKSIHIA